MRINLIGHDNGFGLSHDLDLLRAYLVSRHHEVVFVEWTEPSRDADVNIYVELFNDRHLSTAQRHIGLFNLEWFAVEWLPALPRFTQLWAKSREAHEWYLSNGLPGYYTGFLSRDLFDPKITREHRALHVRGRSVYKNTEQVLEAWRQFHFVLPPLTLISTEAFPAVPGVRQLIGFTDDAEHRREMNRHRFHICPSQSEGWGHYIAEALGCHAAIVTTDASPMNEHVEPELGELIKPNRRIRVSTGVAGMRNAIDPEALAVAVRTMAARSDTRLSEIGLRGRLHWWDRQQQFCRMADDLLARL